MQRRMVTPLSGRKYGKRILAIWSVMLVGGLGIWTSIRVSANTANDAAIADGLTAWRKPDAQGMACVNCHSADGFELARFNFTDENIRRRAGFHVGPADVEKIVTMVHALRDKYQIRAPLDRMNDRPFQPGGRVIAGATPQERDLNTARQTFAPKMPTLFNGRVDSPEKARQARDELLAFDPRREPIGIPFPRISEDKFHGQAHGVLNDWMADMPRLPKDSQAAAEWYALHDRYLADPSEANFWLMYKAVDRLTANHVSGNINAFETAKYKSLLLGQHLMREEALGRSDMASRRPNVFLEVPAPGTTPKNRTSVHDPMFTVGSNAHQNQPVIGDFPELVRRGLNSDLREQLRPMMLPWWYMAWTFNPGLPNVANRHEYFPQSVEGHLGGEPYVIHAQYVHAKMDLARAFVPWERAVGQMQVDGLDFGLTGLGFELNEETAAKRLVNAEHRQMHRTFSANLQRMWLYLTLEEIDKRCAAGGPYRAPVNAGDAISRLQNQLRPELDKVEPQHMAANHALIDTTIRRLREVHNFCQPLPAPGTGTGVKAEFFDNMELRGTPIVRTEPQLAYGFQQLRHPAGKSPFSVRWTGQVQPLFSEQYTFSISTLNDPGKYRLWINGVLLADTTSQGGSTSGKITLEAGRKYDLRLEYYTPNTPLGFNLRWSSTRQLGQVIEQPQLYPTAGVQVPLTRAVFLPVIAGSGAPMAVNAEQAVTDPQPTIQNVTISDGAFAPSSLTARRGATVVWTNQDATLHQIVGENSANSSSEFDSDVLNQGQSFQETFTEPGEYAYFCQIHPAMQGIITIVED